MKIQFMTLAELKKAIKAVAEKRGIAIDYHLKAIRVNGDVRGCNGFVKNPNNGLIVYVSTEMSTPLGKEYGVLYRSAQSLKDYVGGKNWFATPSCVADSIVDLLENQNGNC